MTGTDRPSIYPPPQAGKLMSCSRPTPSSRIWALVELLIPLPLFSTSPFYTLPPAMVPCPPLYFPLDGLDLRGILLHDQLSPVVADIFMTLNRVPPTIHGEHFSPLPHLSPGPGVHVSYSWRRPGHGNCYTDEHMKVFMSI